MERDIRWIQRFSNYKKALEKLQQSIEYIREDYQNEEDNLDEVLDEMMKEGLIQRFEYTHELAWNVMKDYAYYQGNTEIGGSRDATREAFKMNLIKNGHLWMEMIQNRNRTFTRMTKKPQKKSMPQSLINIMMHLKILRKQCKKN